MYKIIIVTMILGSFNVFAKKDKTNYSYCQDVFTNLFNGEFTVSEKHTLEHVPGMTQEPSYDLNTGIYKFFSTDANSKKSKGHIYQVLKDSEGRIRSIESLNDCKDCPRRIELSYSKSTCLPKKVFYTNRSGHQELRAEVETCKSFKELQSDLIKKMNNANSCLDTISEYYKSSADVAGVFAEKISDNRTPHLGKNSQELVKYLQDIQNEAKDLLNANAQVQEKMNSQENIESLLAKVSVACEFNLGRNLLKKGSLFKERKNIYQIKKEDVSPTIQKPKDNIVHPE